MHRTLFASALTLMLLVPLGAAAQDDVGAAEEPICCGAACCLIGGSCFARGDENPEDASEVCDPSMSQDAFSPAAVETDAGTPPTGGTDAGTGTTDDGGGCSVSPGASSEAGLGLGLLAFGALVFRRRR